MVTAHFVGYRRGLKSKQRNNQILLQIDNVQSKDNALKYIGKKISWISPSRRKFTGRITGLHGGSGTVKVTMKKGLPSLAIGAPLLIEPN